MSYDAEAAECGIWDYPSRHLHYPRQIRTFTRSVIVDKSACCTNGSSIDSTPIFGVCALKQPHIFRRQSVDRGLCDRLKYAISPDHADGGISDQKTWATR